jgi:hypothetical protein
MERLLLLWDELDDFAHACRHLATSAVEEVGAVSAPVSAAVSTVSALVLWLFNPA